MQKLNVMLTPLIPLDSRMSKLRINLILDFEQEM